MGGNRSTTLVLESSQAGRAVPWLSTMARWWAPIPAHAGETCRSANSSRQFRRSGRASGDHP